MTPSLALYLGTTIVLSVVRVIVWAYLLAVTTRGAFLRRPSMALILNRIAGAMFIALGLRLATVRQ